MRFLELHLDRFGPFTDRRLTFHPDPALVVVYGLNEAGKSSALAGMVDVLFGIETRSRYDFVHDHSSMRLGATLVDRRGQVLSFRRRKGNKKTLLDREDNPIAADALLPYLGTVHRELFEEAFGLDRERLRNGARRLVEGAGDVGESLLAAAPGMVELVQTKAKLAAEAEELFTVRRVASKPFYQAMGRHELARKAIRENLLHHDALRTARDEVTAAAMTVETLEAERRRLREQKARTARQRGLLPLFRRVESLTARLAALGALPEVPADFEVRRQSASKLRDAAVHERRLAATQERELSDQLAAESVPSSLLEREVEVGRLADQRPAVEKSEQDLPRRRGEVKGHREHLTEIARRLGVEDAEAVLRGQPTALAMARARDLVTKAAELRTARQAAEKQHQDSGLDRERLQAELAECGDVKDPRAARQRFDELVGGLATADARRQSESAVARQERLLDEALARLPIAVESADELARMPAPDRSTVARFETLLAKAAEEVGRTTETRARTIVDLEEVEQRLHELGEGGEVPTPDAIEAARGERTRTWRRVRTVLTGEQTFEQTARTELADQHEERVAHADLLVDRRSSEADRVAQHAIAVVARDKAACRRAELEVSLAVAQANMSQVEAEWKQTWARAGVDPLPPSEMQAFLVAREGALRFREELAAARARQELLESQDAVTEESLRKMACDLAIDLAPDLMPSAVALRLRDELDEISSRWNKAETLRQRLDDLDRAVRKSQQTLDQIEGGEAAWKKDWCEAVEALHLPARCGLAEAEAALTAWDEVPTVAKMLSELEHRVSCMEADCEVFDREVDSLAREVAPDLVGRPSLSVAVELRTRLDGARLVRQAHIERTESLRRARERKRLAGVEQDSAEALLDELMRLTGAASADALPEIEHQVAERDRLRRELADARTELAKASGGTDEEALRGELAEADPDVFVGLAGQLDAQEIDLDGRLGLAQQHAVKMRSGLEQLESQEGAEAAAQEAQTALAELTDVAEEWMVLQTAARLLATAIEEYRKRHQNPILARAQTLFQTLTVGAFDRLEVVLDDDDTPRLYAVRAGGQRLTVDCLSEGTADQLFLALRIATIEDHAARSEPLPLVCDDLFVSFDDERTAAGLQVLADLGATTQTMLFTHHRRVVDLARERLASRVQVIELSG